MTLIFYTLQHLTVDGICGAALARYAVNEIYFEPIVYFFGMYNLIAFGLQAVAGFFLDRYKSLLRFAFVVSLANLYLGAMPGIGIFAQVIFLGVGNCLFHVAAGSLVLQSCKNYREPGIFVSSGAIGLGLGLNQFISAEIFLVAYAVLTFIIWQKFQEPIFEPMNFKIEGSSKFSLAVCAILLLSCVIMRGFGGSNSSSEFVMLFPIIFALGKMSGGICCDKIGWQNTILLIFLTSFLSLQFEGLIPMIFLTLAFNMTMPLTLRLLHFCNPNYPGMMFGLAAGCLLPGVFFKENFTIAIQAMAVLQFLILFAAWKIFHRQKHTAEAF